LVPPYNFIRKVNFAQLFLKVDLVPPYNFIRKVDFAQLFLKVD
jgi:hypothetical protein